MWGAYFCMGPYKRDVVVVIEIGAYIHGVLIIPILHKMLKKDGLESVHTPKEEVLGCVSWYFSFPQGHRTYPAQALEGTCVNIAHPVLEVGQ